VSVRISKSKFCAGVQCLKRLYLLVHSPELAAQPSAADQAIIQQGHEVGMLARKLFSGGVEVCERSLDQAIRATRELVADPEIPAIFEGVFEHGGVLVKIDVLHRRRDGRFRLVEVKSSTDVKEQHLHDVGIQYRVVSRSGLDVGSASLGHVNRNYVVDGQNINLRRFFCIRNLTRRVQRLEPKLTFHLRSEFAVLRMPNAPEIAPGRHCTDPVTCEFFDHCNPARLKDHISYLPRLHASAIEKLEGMGVESIRDIPDDFELSDIQRRACTSVQNGEPWFDRGGLKAALAGLQYPIFFMDFETVNPAIPRFAGMRPYDHLPFQWSVHVRRSPEAKPEHFEFLATDGSDPRCEFITSLCEALGESTSIVVYNAGFESQRLSELATWLPEFTDQIKKIQARLWDLLPVVRNHVYHPAFAGSYSLKAVLPALIPNMSYKGLEVADGTDTGLAWEAFTRGGLDQVEQDRIKKALLDYCGQDTLALVKLVTKLRSVSIDLRDAINQES
jgi:predicted RecB family nuclease